MTKRSTALVLGVFALITVAGLPAGAAIGPSGCTSKKIKAAGKTSFKEFNCYAKAVLQGQPVVGSCLTDEDMKLSDAFTGADGLGDCVNGTGFAAIGPKVTGVVDDVRTPLVGMSTAASTCTSKKLKAAGKTAFKKSNCFAKAIKKGEDVDPACLCTSDAKLPDDFAKAEDQGDCIAPNGDALTIQGTVDAFVTDLIDELTVTTPTSTSTTTTMIPCSCGTPSPTRLSFRNTLGAGSCGTVFDDSGPIKTLDAGKLYVGGGATTLPPSTVPDYGQSILNISLCNGQFLTLAAATSGDTGSIRNCTSAGCFYGPPLPVPNAAAPGTSSCVINTIAHDASGTASCADGSSLVDLPLTSTVFLTSDVLQARCRGTTDPVNVGRKCSVAGNCPGGTCVQDTSCKSGPNSGQDCLSDTDCPPGTLGLCAPHIQPCPICNATTNVCNGGPSDVPGMPAHPCTPAELAATGDEFPTSHDCMTSPGGPLGKLPIPYVLTTGTSTKTSSDLPGQSFVFCGFCGKPEGAGPVFANPSVPCATDADCANVCPVGGFAVCRQAHPSAFGAVFARTVNELGSPAGAIATNDPPAASTLVSVFCIPPTFNALVDAAADLPGPGAACLPGEVQLLP